MARVLLVLAIPMAIAACSLYESSGRQAIEKNSGGILNTSTALIATNVLLKCELTSFEPRFLRSPMDVIANRHEAQGLSVFTDDQAIYLYRRNEVTHSHCSAWPLQGTFTVAIPEIIETAYTQMNSLMPLATRPMSGR